MIFKYEMGDSMIQLSGRPFQQKGIWKPGSIERVIIKHMQEDPVVYSYTSIAQLAFELEARKNIIESARAMKQGKALFRSFEYSRCNPQYWYLTNAGGFMLKYGVRPSDAIQDIFRNSSLYAFECATACIIIFYHAVLKSIGTTRFNFLFQNLYLYSWHFDPDLGIQTFYGNHFLPGDVVYFNNPDYNPRTPWFRGENAVVLGDGTYFGHGFGIRTAEQMVQILNKRRKPWGNRSAYLTNLVSRLSYKHLARFTNFPRGNTAYKIPHFVIHHNKSSISCHRYISYLYKALVPK